VGKFNAEPFRWLLRSLKPSARINRWKFSGTGFTGLNTGIFSQKLAAKKIIYKYMRSIKKLSRQRLHLLSFISSQHTLYRLGSSFQGGLI
jgi:hypothetical protein